MHAALESIGEAPLSPATSMNLRFNNKSGRRGDIAKLAGNLLRFIRSRGNFSTWCRHTEFLQQFLCLVLVNVHACGRSKLELARGAQCSNGFSSTIEAAAATTCALESEQSSDVVPRRRTSPATFANGGIDPGDGEGAERFLSRQSNATGALGHHGRSARWILWNDAGVGGRARHQACHVLSAERKARNSNAHGNDFSGRSGNRRAARGDGWHTDYRDADRGSFGRGHRVTRVA